MTGRWISLKKIVDEKEVRHEPKMSNHSVDPSVLRLCMLHSNIAVQKKLGL
jgi:hypothetical protein